MERTNSPMFVEKHYSCRYGFGDRRKGGDVYRWQVLASWQLGWAETLLKDITWMAQQRVAWYNFWVQIV